MPDSAPITRRLFLRRATALGALLGASALGQACRMAAPATPSCPPSPGGSSSIEPIAATDGARPGDGVISNVVLVVVDGAMPEYLKLGSFPHISRLIANGTSFERAWVGQVVNNTPTSHATIASGTLPARSGVIYFYWRDPSNGKIVKIESDPMIQGDAFASWVRARNIPSVGRTIKQHRPGAKVAAVGSSKDFAAVALGLDAADHVGYAVRLPSQGDQAGTDKRNVDPRGDVLPDAAASAEQAADVSPPNRALIPGSPSWAPLPDAVRCDPRYALTTKDLGDNDLFAGNLAVGLFEAVRPTLLMVNLPDNDQIGHLTGGYTTNREAVTQTMTVADAQIGRLIAAYEKAGLFDRTLWVIVSDHGMTPNSANLNPKLVEKTLAKGGFPLAAGDTSHYWLKDPRDAATAAAAIDVQQAPGFFGSYFKVDQGNGRFVYEPGGRAAEALDAGQRAALEWLLATCAGPESPDLTFILGEKVHFHVAPPNTIGAHSEPTWLLQRIPLIFSGPGVPAGRVSPYPARLVDVAPTILALLGLPSDGMDGVVLDDALAASSQAQRDAKLNAPETRRLLRYQDTLAQLSAQSALG